MSIVATQESMRPLEVPNPLRKRSHLQLIVEILENAKTGSTKTRIMGKVGMSYRQLNEYLEFLSCKGLIESNKGVYHTTSKGVTFVKGYKALLLLFC